MRLFNIKKFGTQNISREIAYRVVWFTYYDKQYKPQEAVAWYVGPLVLDKKRTPHWLYEGEGKNFLDLPRKPYSFVNLINDGEHAIDKTGPIAQIISLQDNLNVEGQQIIDNLRSANGARIIKEGALTAEQIQDCNQELNMVVSVKTQTSQSIDDVIKQLAPQVVSDQLINDKMDSRQTIHSIAATPSQFRGDDSDQTKTASEANLIKNQASGRQDKIVRAIESSARDFFNLLTQLMCVYYDENHYGTLNGGDGNFDFIEMHQNKI
jgi:hypothetical protein